jgi:glucokinase
VVKSLDRAVSDSEPLAGDGYVGAVDLGGTKILAAVVGPDGQVISRSKKSVGKNHAPTAVIDRIAECVRDAARGAGIQPGEVRAVAIGAPGPVVPGEGIVTVAVNLDWHDVPLRAELERRLGVPVVVDNDVRVAVLGEHAVGAGRGTRNLVGIWPGTGIGGGVILDGQILTGVNNAAGEIGHMTIKAGGPRCACGARGHLESLASRSAVTRDIAQRVKKGQKTALTQIVGGDVANATSSDLADAYRQGDKLVIKVANRAAKYLAIGIASVANVLNPEMVILGGGLTEALGEPFVHQVQKELEGRPMLAATQSLKVVKSELGDDAGVVGAALLARRRAMAGRNGLVEQRDEPRSVSAPTE